MLRKCEKCGFDNGDYPQATYCGKCGTWLESRGWTMLAGSPTRAFQIRRDFVEIAPTVAFVSSDENSSLLAFGDMIVLSENDTMSIRRIDNIFDAIAVNIRIRGYGSTPVFVRPFLYSITMGQIAIWHTRSESLEVIDEPQVTPGLNCAPLGIDRQGEKKVVWGLRDRILVVQDIGKGKGKDRFDIRFIPVRGLGEDDLRTPVLWNDQVVFITSSGRLLMFDFNRMPQELSVQQDLFETPPDEVSPPCLARDFVFFESVGGDDVHRIHQFNLQTRVTNTQALSADDFSSDDSRFWWEPMRSQFPPLLNSANNVVIVSSGELTSFLCIDVDSLEPRAIFSREEELHRHWLSMAMGQYMVTVVTNQDGNASIRKVDLSGNTIRVLYEMSLDEMVISPPVYYDGNLFTLSKTELIKWHEP